GEAATIASLSDIILPIVLNDRPFSRGDCNADGSLDISDPIFLLSNLFVSAANTSCEKACDANDDGKVDISDAVIMLNYLFTNSALPGPHCGSDMTVDALTCISPAACIR